MIRFVITIILITACNWLLGQNSIEQYQYWFNSNMAQAVTQSVETPSQNYNLKTAIETTGLPNGLHAFHIRFRDTEEQWSSTLSQFFYKVPESSFTENTLESYEYWFNNDVANAIEGATSSQTLINFSHEFDASALPNGLHTFHIRFKDSHNQWSSTLSQFFYKMPETTFEQNTVLSYEYWFNNDLESVVTGATNGESLINFNEELDVSELPNGLHTFHIRFKDNQNHWSNTLSQFFYKITVSETTENLVKAYRYWFNELDDEIFDIQLETPVNPYNLITNVETPFLELGNHFIHFQFKDTRDQWSVVLTDEFEIDNCLPGFISIPDGDEEVCQGSATNYIVSAALNITYIEWTISPSTAGEISDEGSSAQIEWNDTFSGEATISVKGINPCGETDVKTLNVLVIPTPFVLAMDDDEICLGESIELTVKDFAGNIEWDIPSTTVSPAVTTTYTVTATNECGIDTDEVTIFVNIIDTSVTQVDETLIANADDAYYQWVDCENNYEHIDGEINQEFTPMYSGTYAVIISQGECSEISDCFTVTVSNIYSQENELGITLYPNPTDGQLNILSDVELSYAELRIYNLNGQLLIAKQLTGKTFNINIEGFSSGVYIFKLFNSNKIYRTKIIKNP